MGMLHKVAISLPPDHEAEEAERLQGMLALAVSHGWQEQSLPTGEACFTAYFTLPECAHELASAISGAFPSAEVTTGSEEEKEWHEAWKEFFTPVEGGTHFLVLAPWMEKEKRETSRIPVIIEPKTAFGTGHHETTALCLDAISLLFTEGKISSGMRFLDLGTGSGILGLACTKLGLTGEGLDIEAPAVENSIENREVNGVPAEAFSVSLGSVEAAHGPYDIVLANILAEPLKYMAPAIAALPGTGGPAKRPLLVLSGLLVIQADAVAAAYTEVGYPEPRRVERGEWAALIFE